MQAEAMMRRISAGSGAARLTTAATALGLPLVATVLGTALDLGPFGPPSLYLLAVVAASAIGGRWGGLVAALVAFLGLNYYFTAPLHTLRVSKPEDLVALLVFLGVATIVGTLLARALADRERAERSEDELRLVNRFSTRLLAVELSQQVVHEIAATLVGLMELHSITVEVPADPMLSTTASSALAPAASGDGAASFLDVAIAAGETPIGTLRAERFPGSPFPDSDERLLQAVAGQLGLAIERRRLDTEARAARTGAEISEIRAALFSSVTHDLRTPLASIKAGITGLMDEHLHDEGERRELLTTVLEETDRLNRLLDNILNLARARAGDVAIDKELTPFEDVVETVLARLRGALAPFALRTVIRQELPPIWVDPVKMDQALTNIIENAARHSPPGGEIQVAVTPWRGGLHVRVTDQGPGIPEEEREAVFEPFYRGRGWVGSGSGLGLAIARAVVQAHGGRIWIEGAPGGGAAFVIELPVGTPAEETG